MYKLILLIMAITLTACSSSANLDSNLKPLNLQIDSFDKCVAAGYPIARSYPAQCRTPEGKVFWGSK